MIRICHYLESQGVRTGLPDQLLDSLMVDYMMALEELDDRVEGVEYDIFRGLV